MDTSSGRRLALMSIGLGIAGAAGLTALPAGAANAADASLIPPGAKKLEDLTARLAKAPRRRDFKTVPMILDNPDQWDHEALSEVIAYRGGPKQVWDNTNIAGPWLNLMRNSLNTQIWSFKHPNFLPVSATHGAAHLALFSPAVWEKYDLGKLIGGKFQSNKLLGGNKTAASGTKDYENPNGPFSPHDNTISVLQARGVVFLACHNAIWEIAAKLIRANLNPDKLSHEAVAAELTNKLIPGAVLTPGIVATIPRVAARRLPLRDLRPSDAGSVPPRFVVRGRRRAARVAGAGSRQRPAPISGRRLSAVAARREQRRDEAGARVHRSTR